LKTQKSAWTAFPSFREVREAVESDPSAQAHKPGIVKCLVLYALVSGAYVFHVISSVDRRGRRIARQLMSFPEGSYLHLVFKDKTDCFGHLGPLATTSFAFTEATTNSVTQIPYNDIESVAEASPSIHRPLLSWAIVAMATAVTLAVMGRAGI
jgi:hypothetical protein